MRFTVVQDHTFFIGNETADGLIPLEYELGIRKAVGLSSTQHKSMMVDGIPRHMGDDELHLLISAKFGNVSAMHRTRLHPSLAVVEFVHRFPFIDAMQAQSLPLEHLADGSWGVMNVTGLTIGGTDSLDGNAAIPAEGDPSWWPQPEHGAADGTEHGDQNNNYYKPYDPYKPYDNAYRDHMMTDDMYAFSNDFYRKNAGTDGRELLSVGQQHGSAPGRGSPRALGGGTDKVAGFSLPPSSAAVSSYASLFPPHNSMKRSRRSVPNVLVPSPGLEGDATTSPRWQRRRLSAATFSVFNASAAAGAAAADENGGDVEMAAQVSLGERARSIGERAKERSTEGGARLPEGGTSSNGTGSLGPMLVGNSSSSSKNGTINMSLSDGLDAATAAVVIEHELVFWPVTVVGALSGLDEKTVKAIEANRGKDPGDKHEHDSDEDLEDVSEEISSSRFQDNSELQYSIRSIERFAPWVRKIYIVTNGQIPSWINLDHPRLQIVPHSDIFLNTSHLPVFSSPAIEANLHRIPGLSKKFIYLNDDVMFGTPIWPEDFYTHAKGQKAYLAWPVPNCVEACPSNWVGDKYCDQACNNIECEWDGGDCLAKNAEAAAAGHDGGGGGGNNNDAYTTAKPLETCVVGCSDIWLGDKFCDKACEKPECGMDGGDCGMDALKGNIPGVRAYQGMPMIVPATLVPEGSPRPQSIFLNMSEIFGGENDTIAEGLYDSTSAVAAAVVNKVENVLTLIFRPNINCTVVRVTVSTREGALEELPDPFEFVNVTKNATNTSNATVVLEKRFKVITTTAAPHRDPYAGIERDVNGTITLAFSILVDTTPQPTTTTTFASAPAFGVGAGAANATLDGNGNSNTTGTVRIVDGGRSVNYWEVEGADGSNATSNDGGGGGGGGGDSAAPTQRAKSDELIPPAVDESTLPAEVQKDLAALRLELADGDITQKGYAKYAYRLLLPYAPGETAGAGDTTAGAGSPDAPSAAAKGDGDGVGVGAANSRMRRSLMSLSLPPGVFSKPMVHSHQSSLGVLRWFGSSSGSSSNGDGGGGRQAAPSLGPPEQVWNGITISAEDAFHADWIADQKRKEYSYKDDMRRAVKEWETRMGQPWLNDTIPSNKISSFPWERLGIFDHLVDEEENGGSGAGAGGDGSDGGIGGMTSFKPTKWHSRLTKDTFGDSLKKVNRLYNKEFGFAARKVIAHMPHMIDKEIMQDLIDKFPAEWAATSSHRLRSGQDMQYAFAYFYYLMGVENPFNTSKYFTELDSDLDGLLSVHELRTLITRLYELPTTLEDWVDFEEILLNCSHLQPPMEALGVGIGPEAEEVWVTEQLFADCSPLMAKFNKTVGKENRYKFELESDEHDIAFKMVRNNASKVAQQLDVIRREPKKFICLNDNIDHRKKSASQVVDALQNFYQSFFPIRSQFELPVGLRNRFLHVDELRAWRKSQQNVVWWSKVAMVIIFLIMCSSVYGKKIKRWRRTWLRMPFRTSRGSRASAGNAASASSASSSSSSSSMAPPMSPGKLA